MAALAGLALGAAPGAVRADEPAGSVRVEAPSGRAAESAATALFLRATEAYRGGQLAEAAEDFRLAAELDPTDGQAHLMEGITRYRLGQRALARRRLRRALELGLDAEDRALAEEYLAMAGGTAGPSPWFGLLLASAGGGWDSNVVGSGASQHEALERGPLGRGGAGFASAMLLASVGRRLGSLTSTEVGYALFQLAYPDPRYQGYSVQDHALEWRNLLDWRAVQLALPVRAELSLAGLGGSYAPFQRAGVFDPQLTIVQAAWTRSRLGAQLAAKAALDPAFAYLDGWRFEASFAQELRLGPVTVTATGRHRREALGTRRSPAGVSSDGRCPGCAVAYVTPQAYQATSVALRLAARLGGFARAGLAARAEDRHYAEPHHVEAVAPGGAVRRWGTLRHDRRFGGSAELRVGGDLAATVRWETIVNRSSVDGETPGCEAGALCHPLDYESRSYVKHLLSLELEIAWL